MDFGTTRIPKITVTQKCSIAIFAIDITFTYNRHINIRYHFIKEHVEKGTIELYFVGTEYQLADLFTKALPREKFEYLVHRIGMRCMSPTELDRLAKLSSCKVPDTKDTIKFKLDTQVITYTVDMFRDTLHLPVETPDNPFVAPVNSKVIESIMQRVGYQGVVDKVSSFYTKFLAQPWHTMFKVFNHCMTTRTSWHDQTKINILQLFHVVVNYTHVDYAALLWWDFINCVFQKKDVIQYSRFTKLIITYLMKKFPFIPQRIDEEYHSIKDDIPLVSVYTTGNVQVRGMLISNEFLTDEIRGTDDYTKYEMVFVKVVVLMNQPQPVVSTQGMHRSTPKAHRIPTLTSASPQGKKRKQSAGETSSPSKSLKVTIKQKHVVEGEKHEESYAHKFAASMLHDDVDDSNNRIEPRSHEENPEHVDDNDENEEEHKDEKKDDEMGIVADTVIQERDAFQSENNVIQVYHTTTTSTDTISSAYLQQQLYLKMKSNLQDQDNDPALWDVLKQDDAPPKGEKRVKRHKTSKSSKFARGSSSKRSAKESTSYVTKQQHQQQEWDAWEEETVIDEDEVIPKDETPKLIIEFQNVDKCIQTIFDRARMEATLNNMLSNQFRNAEKYAYHLKQATNFIENRIVWESRQEDIRRSIPKSLNGNTMEKKYIRSLHKIRAEPFTEADLEEKMNRWVRKEFKNFNEDIRIAKVVRITADQLYGLDFMEQIIVMRENDKPDSFSEADFKYLNKIDIEDFISAGTIGIESYQIMVNLTAPTLTFPGIEAHESYSIVDKPNTSLIYLNNKDEKRVMYLVEFVRFCDAALERVLNEVKLRIFQISSGRNHLG
ncbi:hypothetical protein Tco_0824494 [Tanacetum coccineum]|uniref:Uncharacterized protein n=1 Tax=Tanacetum coccineum TaxID=301880 RepID=A0ABQ5AKW7_9ASTR